MKLSSYTLLYDQRKVSAYLGQVLLQRSELLYVSCLEYKITKVPYEKHLLSSFIIVPLFPYKNQFKILYTPRFRALSHIIFASILKH